MSVYYVYMYIYIYIYIYICGDVFIMYTSIYMLYVLYQVYQKSSTNHRHQPNAVPAPSSVLPACLSSSSSLPSFIPSSSPLPSFFLHLPSFFPSSLHLPPFPSSISLFSFQHPTSGSVLCSNGLRRKSLGPYTSTPRIFK